MSDIGWLTLVVAIGNVWIAIALLRIAAAVNKALRPYARCPVTNAYAVCTEPAGHDGPHEWDRDPALRPLADTPR